MYRSHGGASALTAMKSVILQGQYSHLPAMSLSMLGVKASLPFRGFSITGNKKLQRHLTGDALAKVWAFKVQAFKYFSLCFTIEITLNQGRCVGLGGALWFSG